MLTAAQFDQLSVPITEFYEEFAQSIINDIARRLVKMGEPTATAAWQLQKLIESGQIYENVISQLSKITGQSEQILKQTFEKAGVTATKFDDQIYRAAGLNPLPLNLSPQALAVLQAGLNKTNGLINNLVQTTAISSQQSFIKAADLAYQQVISGTMGYDQAIRAAIKNIGASGLEVIYPTGHIDKLDVAMRRAVLTGIGQTTGNLQLARMDDMGTDLVEVSQHLGARPSHQIWQGKIYSRSGNSKYPDFVSSTGYGTGAGLAGWNCRHSFYPFFEGVSKPALLKEQQEEFDRQNDKVYEFNGKKLTQYEAEQTQRGIERKIRLWKRQAEALKAANLEATKEVAKVKEWQAKMRIFIDKTKLQRQYIREKV